MDQLTSDDLVPKFFKATAIICERMRDYLLGFISGDLQLRLRSGGFGGNDQRLSFAAIDFFAVILTAKIEDNKASTGVRLAAEHD
nr:hypothetical protein Itr_chr10CG18880 [Ipomoea trifida]